MPGWLGLIAARLLTQNGASAWIMACTITGAAAGASALTPAHTTPVRSIPAAIATPAPLPTTAPCMRFIGNDGNGCAGQGWHHSRHRRHHHDWDDDWQQGGGQPSPAVPTDPNGGTVGGQTGGTF